MQFMGKGADRFNLAQRRSNLHADCMHTPLSNDLSTKEKELYLHGLYQLSAEPYNSNSVQLSGKHRPNYDRVTTKYYR